MSALEASLSPFHRFDRSHAYDDDTVMARAARRIYAARRLAARKRARDSVCMLLRFKNTNNSHTYYM
jgi:hypothetical protein